MQPPPLEHLIRVHIVIARHPRHRRPRLQRLLDDVALLRQRKSPAAQRLIATPGAVPGFSISVHLELSGHLNAPASRQSCPTNPVS